MGVQTTGKEVQRHVPSKSKVGANSRSLSIDWSCLSGIAILAEGRQEATSSSQE